MNPIFINMFYYMIVMVLTFFVINFLMRGFFLKFLEVKFSLGKKIIIKIRHTIFDDFAVGTIEEGFLVFSYPKKSDEKRLAIPDDEKVFYRVLNTNWIDVDGTSWGICRCDYSTVSAHDPAKVQNFLKRIIMQPKHNDETLRLIMILCIVALVLIVGNYIFTYLVIQKVDSSIAISREIINLVKPTIIGATTP